MSDIIVLAAKQSNTKSAYCLLVHSHPSFRLSGDCMHGAGGNKSFTGYYMRIYGDSVSAGGMSAGLDERGFDEKEGEDAEGL